MAGKTSKVGDSAKRDRIDALVNNLDKYYFRMGEAENLLSGSTYGQLDDYVDGVRELFETASGKKAKARFYTTAKKAEVKIRGIAEELESAAIEWQSQEETFTTLLGFVLGLRMAGIDSERVKQMARTWRLGYPQDDRY